MKINNYIKTILLWMFLFLLGTINGLGQNYPVHLTTQLVAPFSGYLPDYANAGEEKLKILILFTDFTKPNYNIKLKISIKGQGVSIQSKSYYFDGPFNLQPGVPLEISGSELYGLLNSQNLDFTGINKSDYEQRKVLPEGFYSVCITAYDFNNPVPIQVSNISCAQAWMILSDPPFLNLPICSSTVTTANPQQQTFSFTQMNMGSPNSAANTEYIFQLWEIRPQGAIPNNIIATVPPIYSYTTNLTSINYGITEPPLIKGLQYAWRVQAIDITGRDYFKNQGYSQVCTFTYGSLFDGSNLNLNLSGQGVSQRQIKVWWDSLSVFSNYNLEFRKAGSNGNWYPTTTSNHSLRVLDLEPQTTYEVHVQGVGAEYTSPFSASINVTTLPMPNYQCGDMPVVPSSAQFQPLTLANTNMIWQVGQFEMRVTQLQNVISGTGMYSGMGKITMPYGININCGFTNVLVNSDQIVMQGKVTAVTQAVNEWINSNGVGTIQNGTANPEIQVNGTITSADINVNNSNGTFTVGGNTYSYTPNGATIEDSNGNMYVVTQDGQVINAGTAGSGHGPVPDSKNIINTSRGTINFIADANQLYGLDVYTHQELINYYLTVKNVTDNTHPPVNWKSVMAQKYDVVDLDYEVNSGLKPDSILYITGTGTIYKPQGSGTSRKLYIVGGLHGDVQELFACYKVKKDSFINIAKINLVSYRLEQNKVTLVPLGNNITIDKTQLQQQLNNIYKQSVATWTVDVAPPITVGDTMWDKDGDGHINVGSNLFSRYSTELKAINKYIRNQTYYNASEYFLVVTNKPTDSLSADLLGEMPRGCNIGYIFSATPKAQLMAHELGHGAFALEHSFDGNATLPKGTTTCLMDYTNGADLYKGKYWDYVHDPVTVIGILDDDDNGADYEDNVRRDLFKLLSDIKNASINNQTLTLGKYYNLYTPSCNLAGVQYDYISISGSNSQGITISPKGNIKFSTSQHYYAATGQTQNFPCLDIDGGKLKIEVSANGSPQLQSMKYYLEGSMTGKNLLLFVNGYRSLEVLKVITSLSGENPKGTDEVTSGDIYGYWVGIDAQFINQIGTRNVVYADGHNSITTSNHIALNNSSLSVTNFIGAMVNSNDLKQYCASSQDNVCSGLTADFLHTTANTIGFSTRKSCGTAAGNDLVAKINNGAIIFNITTDTLDIVCHSMGYAYALGMIQTLKIAGIHFGRFYIIAPENAGSGPVPSGFQEIWQYGANEKRDFAYLQDGVAPQTIVPGMNSLPKGTIGNRVFIPNDGSVPMGFVESHTIGNYNWIFKKTSLQQGYVKPRK